MNERRNQLLNEIITVRDYRGAERGSKGREGLTEMMAAMTETKRDVTLNLYRQN